MTNLIQHLRSLTPDAVPNTDQVSVGEIALNLADRKIFTSNGSAVFELGANVVDLEITGGLTANGSLGTDGQVLTSNGSVAYWSTVSGGGIASLVEDTSPQLGGDLDTNSNRIILGNGSANLPTLSFQASPNSGFYAYTDTIAISINSAEISYIYENTGNYIFEFFGDGIFHGNGTFNLIKLNNAGNATTPSLILGGDVNTGLFRPGSDIVGITAGGVEGMRITETAGSITITANGNLNVSANLTSNVITANTLQNSNIKNYTVVSGTPDANSGNITFDYSDGPDFQVTLTGNVTSVSFSNLPPSNLAKLSIKFIQDGSGGEHTVDLSSINFGNANTPSMLITNNAIMEIVAWTRDGNNIFGVKTFEYDGS